MIRHHRARQAVVSPSPLLPLQAQGGGDPAQVDSVGAGNPIVQGLTGLDADVQVKLLVSVAAVALLMLLRRVVLKVVERRVEDPATVYRWSKATGYATFVVGLLVVFQVWFTAILSLGTFLGLLSAGLAIALKDLVADLAGWAFILWRRAKVLLLDILLDAAGDTSQEAEARLKKTASKYLLHYKMLTPVVYTSVEESGVVLTLRYLCHPRQRRGSADAIWERVLDMIERTDDLTFAYPAHRVFLKPDPRDPPSSS